MGTHDAGSWDRAGSVTPLGLLRAAERKMFGFFVGDAAMGLRCLEIGAGAGGMTAELVRRGARVTATDPDADMLALLPDTDGVSRRVASAESLVSDGSIAECDMLVFAGSLEFVGMESFTLCARALRSGGMLMAVGPAGTAGRVYAGWHAGKGRSVWLWDGADGGPAGVMAGEGFALVRRGRMPPLNMMGLWRKGGRPGVPGVERGRQPATVAESRAPDRRR